MSKEVNAAEAKDWVNLFCYLGNKRTGYGKKNVTCYMHSMVFHVPEAMKTHRNVKKFTGQGVEKNNDDARRVLRRKSNNWDSPADIIRTEGRQWALRKRERLPRAYNKKKIKKDFEVEVEELENEFQVSKEENKKREEQITKLTLSYDKVSKKIERMTKDREESKVENKTLKREISDLRDENSSLKKKVDDLQENIQRLEYSGRIGRLPLTMGSPTQVEKAAIILGEMCTRVLAMMYQKVHPDEYEEDCSYTLKNIEEDIEEIEHKGARQEAKYKWEELKKKLNWNKSLHPRILKAIRKERNIVAHPSSLTKGLLLRSVEDMKEAGKLGGWKSFSRVNEIINIWDLLGQME
ncbi:hypothetical protein AWC38_SpisGene14450 [Stylophora pistillata]|uniref:Uncharacterized protein n=1 Tax=Stylophora pistillata TaxID=50429 RepID=A0A2B4RRL9_STYPI|nr:hypothetical protein AWC38_SpisGene14450 [Stylophora pistillata]